MIYLDNAATTHPKPASVYERVDSVLRNWSANPGRSGHAMAIEAARIIFQTRESIAKLFNIPDPDRITPAATATFALVMLATTAHGDAYTFAEYQSILARAGFQRSEFHALPPTTQQAVVSYKG